MRDLLRAEQVNVDGALVVGVHDLPPLVVQGDQAPGLERSRVAVRRMAGHDVSVELAAQIGCDRARELHPSYSASTACSNRSTGTQASRQVSVS